MPHRLTLCLLMSLLLPTAARGKNGPTYYTPERVATARYNVEHYDWAKAQLQRIMRGDAVDYYVGHDYTSAARYVEASDEQLWFMQPETTLPRIYPHESRRTDPVEGKALMRKFGFETWLIDPLEHPYKVQSRLTDEWYPKNDFLAYYKSGLGEDGRFDEALADQALLHNTEHPDPDDPMHDAFVDSGGGFTHQENTVYPIREYAKYVYSAVTIPTLRSLTQAYVLTGEQRYAHKAAVLLARVAFVYPDYEDPVRKQWVYYATVGGRDPHHSWKTGGMITDLIWETFCFEDAVLAYDAVYDHLDDDPALIAFLRERGMPIKDADDLRRYIEDRLIRPGMRAIQLGHIHGNEGFHQAAAMAAALVLDDYTGEHPNSKDMVDWTFLGEGRAAHMLVNSLSRDGGGHESPGYNRIKLRFIRVNRLMEQIRQRRPEMFPLARYPDIFAGDKAQALFNTFIDLQIAGAFMPSIGDSGKIHPIRRQEPSRHSYLTHENLYAFSRYGDPRLARASIDAEGDFFTGELFQPYPIDAMKRALADPASHIVKEPRLLDGYGVAILETGADDHRRAVALNYTALAGHRQSDHLSLGLFARGLRLLPDLGYPYTWDWRWVWDGHITAHNTVTVDQTQASHSMDGICRLFASADGVHVVTASHNPYPANYLDGRLRPRFETYVQSPETLPAKGVDLYERTVVLVDVDETRFYVVDLFAVRGGTLHDQSWHGPLVPIQAPDELAWRKQPGTFAGPEIAQFETFVDRWGRQRQDFYSFVTDVQRASLNGPATWGWKLGLAEGDQLRMHLVPVDGPTEILQGQGRSPARPEDWALGYVLARRQVEAGERSLFLTVFETYQDEPVVHDLRLVSQSPLVLEVARADGSDRIHLHISEEESRTTATRPVGIRVVSHDQAGRSMRDVKIGQWSPAASEGSDGYVHSRIAAVDHEEQRIILTQPPQEPSAFAVGHAIRIFNDARSAMFRIVDAGRTERGRFFVELDRTALMARGPVVEAGDSRLVLDAELIFANGKLDEDGRLVLPPGEGRDYFAGSRLGEGPEAPRLRGASEQVLFVDKSENAADASGRAAGDSEQYLQRYVGRIVSVYQYGAGDRVEVARVSVAP